MIGNLQLLRVFAASGVVIYHTHARIFGLSTEFHGVALFFVLSGYLMCKINNRSAFEFARDRVLRIVPAYWLATALLLTLFRMWNYWPIEHTILSFLFIPHDSVAGVEPVLGVGWTLNLEMYFYAIFTMSILINQRIAPIVTGAFIMTVSFAIPYLTNNKAALYYYAHKDIKFFVIGITLWYITEWLKNQKFDIHLPSWTFPLAMAIYIIDVVFFAGNWIAVTLLFFVTVLAANYHADLKPNLLILLGNASYACYLLHIILIEFLRHKGIETSGSLLFTTSVLVTSWMLAVTWYLTVEKFLAVQFSRVLNNIDQPHLQKLPSNHKYDFL